MNISLLTIWHEMNYGAELQAYATIKLLQKQGHQVEMIYILLSDCRKPNLNGKIGNVISHFGPGRRKFVSFWRKYIPVSKRYSTLEQLISDPPKGDIYMVGSDQVWNPDLTGEFAKLFFLNFGDENIRRISFASSFGSSEWSHIKLIDEVKELLHRFSTVSCREQSGIDILKNTFGVEADLVLDPTLLLEDYSELTGTLKRKRSIVYYPLSDDPELMSYARHLSEQLGYQLINNNQSSKILGRFPWDRISIEEWIRNIAESQFVITRSFHGLAFSIIYKRPFAIIANKNNRGTRILNLLEQLGIQNRYYENIEACEEAKPWNQPIDYEAVYGKLIQLRSKSIDYLNIALR